MPNPTFTMSSSKIQAHLIQTAHSLQSASKTIASDDDTLIGSIIFKDAAVYAIWRLQWESKGRVKAKDE